MTATAEAGRIAPAPAPSSAPVRRRRLVGLGVLALGVVAASVGHAAVPQVGVLTWAIGLGMLAANTGLVIWLFLIAVGLEGDSGRQIHLLPA